MHGIETIIAMNKPKAKQELETNNKVRENGSKKTVKKDPESQWLKGIGEWTKEGYEGDY